MLVSMSIACTDPTGPEPGIQDDDPEVEEPDDGTEDGAEPTDDEPSGEEIPPTSDPVDDLPAEELPSEEEPGDELPPDQQPPVDDDLPDGDESDEDESESPPPDDEPSPPQPNGELGVAVQHDLPGAFPLASMEDVVELAYGQSVNLSLPDSPVIETITWFLNGEEIPADTGRTLTIGEDLPAGRHTVSVMAATGASQGSANIVLQVRRTPADRVVLGRNRGYLLTERGDLYGWGTQSLGVLLNGEYSGEVSAPMFLMADVQNVAPAELSTFVLTRDGTLSVTGEDPFGLFGLPSYGFHPTPRRIGTDVVAISASRSHALYIQENTDGTQSLWGWGDKYGIAQDVDHSEPVPIMDGIVAIAAGDHYSLAITDEGHLYGWGRNENYQLGTGSSDAVTAPRLLALDAETVAAGDAAAAYIDSAGILYTSGLKYRVPSAETQTEWSRVFSGARSVVMGSTDGFLIDDNDDLWAWGINGGGELGTGHSSVVVMPVRVLRDVRTVAVGSTFPYGFSGAIRQNGTLFTWGADLYESLGNGAAGDSMVPREVSW